MVVTSERKSKEERREEILDAALEVFADQGLHGASTEEIARRAGISQPYVFRLFGTKKELYVAGRRPVLPPDPRADAAGRRGQARAGGARGDRRGLRRAARGGPHLPAGPDAGVRRLSGDPEIAAVVRDGFGDLVTYVERVSGASQEEISAFFAGGMLLNVLASMEAPTEPWGARLVEGCKSELTALFFDRR